MADLDPELVVLGLIFLWVLIFDKMSKILKIENGRAKMIKSDLGEILIEKSSPMIKKK